MCTGSVEVIECLAKFMSEQMGQGGVQRIYVDRRPGLNNPIRGSALVWLAAVVSCTAIVCPFHKHSFPRDHYLKFLNLKLLILS